jgi:hypothetical protein
MSLYRVSIGFPFDTALPRDVVTINPHFAGDNPGALADALVSNLIAVPAITAARPFTVKVYDGLKAPPSFPLATRQNGTGFWNTNWPKEVALCLSYYSTYNRPHSRGRFYIPATLLTGSIGVRPSTPQMQQVLDFRNVFITGMPTGTKWSTWSPTTQNGEPVSHCWVDNEWDTVRSRGGRADNRLTAAVSIAP